MDDRWRLLPVAAFIAFMCVVAALLGSCSANTSDSETERTVEYGQPLDAVEYAAPSFADDDEHPTWRVVDRQSHQAWWMVWVGGKYVVLPIGEVMTGDE